MCSDCTLPSSIILFVFVKQAVIILVIQIFSEPVISSFKDDPSNVSPCFFIKNLNLGIPPVVLRNTPVVQINALIIFVRDSVPLSFLKKLWTTISFLTLMSTHQGST
jgi:hypothetical protein